MTPRNALLATTVIMVVLFSANWAVGRMARNSVPRQLIRTIDSAPSRIDVLGIGNSLMAAGFDGNTIQTTFLQAGRPVTAVNGSLGSTSVIEHLVLARFALERHTVRTLVYGFFDLQMSSDLPHNNGDLIGNHALLYYLEPQLTLKYAPFDSLNKLAFEVYRCCELLIDRGAIWAKIERLRRGMEEIGMPSRETNQFGRRADFNLLESDSPSVFQQACSAAIRSHAFLSAPVFALLQQARSQGAKVIVIEMPMPPLHVKRFYDQPVWQEFRAGTRAEVEHAGATYLNGSHWIPDDRLFQDSLHLSSEGAASFSHLLAQQLIDNDVLQALHAH